MHRLGVNHDQIPINCPFHVNNFQQDGLMNVVKNQEKQVTYYENSMNVGPRSDHSYRPSFTRTEGLAGRYDFINAADDYE